MRKLIPVVLCAFAFISVYSQQPQDRYQPTWESLSKYKTPDWFRDAKFGIFIHWGVYSVPAFNSEWYPRNMYQQGSDEYKHQIEKYGPEDKFGYKDFIPMFKAEKFNADEWVALFKKAGAKYVVPVRNIMMVLRCTKLLYQNGMLQKWGRTGISSVNWIQLLRKRV